MCDDSNEGSTASSPLSLSLLGWSDFFEQQRTALDVPLEPARITEGGRSVFHVLSATGPRLVAPSGRLLHEARGRDDLPAVGDWVGLTPTEGDGVSVIAHRFRRRTCLIRKNAGRRTEAQVLAANVDAVMIISALDAEFNPRRLERWHHAVLESGARPVFVLNKADLCEAKEGFLEVLRTVAPACPAFCVSARDGSGLDALRAHVGHGETVVLVGSSGVGKSTITNRLLGSEEQRAGAIRERDGRGRHVTSHRELFLLPGGGLLMDTPGLRELGLWGTDEATPLAFEEIGSLASSCRFRDCQHRGEPGCAVQRAIEEGAVLPERLESFQKLESEQAYLRDRKDARARANDKRRSKEISRLRKLPNPKR